MLLLGLVAIAAQAHAAFFEIVPQAPRYMEPVILRINFAELTPPRNTVMYGATVQKVGVATVVRLYEYESTAPTTLDVLLGAYPSGEYGVVVETSDGHAFGAISFTVGAAPIPGLPALGGVAVPSVNYSGQWWSPQDPGWGLAITQGPTNVIYAEWLTYDDAGQPTWLSLGPGQWISGEAPMIYSAPIRRTTTTPAMTVPKQPPVTTDAGVATLTFTDNANGTLTLVQSNGTVINKAITRLPIE
jgi:hypothetical protein